MAQEQLTFNKITIDDVRELIQKKDYVNAEKLCILILQKDPKHAEALYILAHIKKQLGRLEDSTKCLESAVKLAEAKIGDWYIELGNQYCNEEKLNEALSCYFKALATTPQLKGNLFNNIGIAFKKKKDYAKALDFYTKAMELNPQNPAAYSNMALVQKELGNFDKATELYKKSIELKPDFATGYYNWGLLLKDQNKPEEALPLLEKCYESDTNYNDLYMDWAICLLLTKNFEKGWQVYENRYAGKIEPKPINAIKPKWRGESLEGKTIYVFHEQGSGDTIQFARYLPQLKDLGANVLFKPQKGLEKLFEQNDLKADILDEHITEEKYDYYSLLLSLPCHLKATDKNIPFSGGYLKAEQEKVKEYKEKYFDNDKFKVGIFWQGSNTYKNDINRSTKLSNFFELSKLENVQLYSLQKGFGEEQLNEIPDDFNIIRLGDTFEDFSDTAAAIENLDLVITVDSAISHLSGALGKPIWILMSYVWEWRWFGCEDKTPWYDSMKIFHQDKTKDWKVVFGRVIEELKTLSNR